MSGGNLAEKIEEAFCQNWDIEREEIPLYNSYFEEFKGGAKWALEYMAQQEPCSCCFGYECLRCRDLNKRRINEV